MMDVRLIVKKSNLTRKEKPLMEAWVQYYLTIYPSLYISNKGLKSSFVFVPFFILFKMSACEPDLNYNLNNFQLDSYPVRIEPESVIFGDQLS